MSDTREAYGQIEVHLAWVSDTGGETAGEVSDTHEAYGQIEAHLAWVSDTGGRPQTRCQTPVKRTGKLKRISPGCQTPGEDRRRGV
ncbi:hypothetical protein D9M72_543340 [compost metagenome]